MKNMPLGVRSVWIRLCRDAADLPNQLLVAGRAFKLSFWDSIPGFNPTSPYPTLQVVIPPSFFTNSFQAFALEAESLAQALFLQLVVHVGLEPHWLAAANPNSPRQQRAAKLTSNALSKWKIDGEI